MQDLYHRLKHDLRNIGIKEDFELELKPYSKTFYGRYDPNRNTIILYVYEDSSCTRFIPYKELFLTLVHESIHCIQWHDKSFVRVKGVMHNEEFHRLYNYYKLRAESLLSFKEVSVDAKKNQRFSIPKGRLEISSQPV